MVWARVAFIRNLDHLFLEGLRLRGPDARVIPLSRRYIQKGARRGFPPIQHMVNVLPHHFRNLYHIIRRETLVLKDLFQVQQAPQI